jgi:hypothetical protein
LSFALIISEYNPGTTVSEDLIITFAVSKFPVSGENDTSIPCGNDEDNPKVTVPLRYDFDRRILISTSLVSLEEISTFSGERTMANSFGGV